MGFEIDKISMPRVFAGPLQQDGTPPPPPPPAEENTFGDNGGINIVVLDSLEWGVGPNGEQTVPHSQIVSSVIQEVVGNSANVNIEQIEGGKNGFWDWLFHPGKTRMNIELENLVERAEKGEDIDAVNISLASYTTFDELNRIYSQYGEDKNISITRDNLHQHSDTLVKALKTAAMHNEVISQPNDSLAPVAEFVRINEHIRNLENHGVEVYIAAGNRGPDFFNLDGLVPEVDIIGAVDGNGITPYSANNSLVDEYAWGEFNGHHGTSVASPRALAEDILAEVNQREPSVPEPPPPGNIYHHIPQ